MKRLTWFLVAGIAGLMAQQTTFYRTYGNGIYDSGEGVLISPDSGYVVGGITTRNGVNGTEMMLYKTDSLGNLVWFKSIGDDNVIEGAQSISIANNGTGYVLAGYKNNFDTSSYNFFIVKTDGNGDTVWTRTLGGSNLDMAHSIDTTADDAYIIAGETYSYGAGGRDFYVVKMNDMGDTVWTRTFGGTNDDWANYVYVDRNNNIVVIGTTFSYGSGGSDVYIVYLNPLGDTIWTKAYGTVQDEIGYCGDMYIDNGNSMSLAIAYSQFNLISNEHEARFFRADSISCNLYYDYDWFFTQPKILDHSRMRMDGKGKFIITGDLREGSTGNHDIYIHRTSYGMGFNIHAFFLNDGEEYPKDIQKCIDNGLVLTGNTTSFGPGPTTSFILKTDSLMSGPTTPIVSAEDFVLDYFDVRPNPVTGHLVFVDAGYPIREIYLLNMSGQVIMTESGNAETTQYVTMPDVNAGMYIIQVITDYGLARKKLLITQ